MSSGHIVLNGAETLPKISIGLVGCTNVADRQTTDRRTDDDIANMNMSSRSLKMELKNGSFQYGKVALAVRTKKTSVTVCAQSGRRLRGHAPVVPLSNCSVIDVLVEATPLLDGTVFQVVDVANPATVDALLEHAPHLIVYGI